MNWVENEYLAVADAQNPDAWILSAPLYRHCEHRWRPRANPVHSMARGFYSLDRISVCARCGAEA